MTARNAAIFLLWLSCIAQVQAADCKKEKLDEGERLSAYLREYSQECIDQPVKSQLERWRIGPSTEDRKRDEANLSLMVAAWKDISAGFGKLANETPETVGGARSSMKDMYRQLAVRADATRSALALALQQQASPDIAAFRLEAWQVPPKMVLLEFSQPGEPHLPLLDVGSVLNADCSNRDSALCQSTLRHGRELMLQWKLAEEISGRVSASTIRDVVKQIAAKDALWDKYLYDSKPMLPFDFVLTDLLEGRWKKSDQYPDGFPVPPKTQWFLLHPSFGFEYASAAADGQQMKPILYVELIGANRWSKDNRWIDVPGLRYFSGFSLIVSYADRAGIKDTGYGALFTFDNVYSIGVNRYGSDNGIFLSLDLANLYRDKLKPQYQALRTRLDNQVKLP